MGSKNDLLARWRPMTEDEMWARLSAQATPSAYAPAACVAPEPERRLFVFRRDSELPPRPPAATYEFLGRTVSS